MPVPLLIGTRGWGLFVESQRVGLFDVARKEPDLVQVTYGTRPQRPTACASTCWPRRAAARRAPSSTTTSPATRACPRRGRSGPGSGATTDRDQAEVEDDIAQIRALDLATSGDLDRPPVRDGGQHLRLLGERATRIPRGMIQRFARRRLPHGRCGTSPYLEPAAEPLRTEAASSGYFPPHDRGPAQRVGQADRPHQPGGVRLVAGAIGQATRALGIEGYKLDYAEDVVPGVSGARNLWRFADGSDERTMHYDYQLLYHRVYAETLPDDRRLPALPHGPLGRPEERLGHLAGRHRRDLRAARRDVLSERQGAGVGGLPASVIVGPLARPLGLPVLRRRHRRLPPQPAAARSSTSAGSSRPRSRR